MSNLVQSRLLHTALALPDEPDVLRHAVFAVARHEDVEEVLTANGEQLDGVLARHGGRPLRVVQQRQLLHAGRQEAVNTRYSWALL